MAVGPITVPAPKVVARECGPGLAPILRPRTVVPSVQVKRSKCATHKPVQVLVVGVDISYAFLFYCYILFEFWPHGLASDIHDKRSLFC